MGREAWEGRWGGKVGREGVEDRRGGKGNQYSVQK